MSTPQAAPPAAALPPPNTLEELLRRQNRPRSQLLRTARLMRERNGACEYDQEQDAVVEFDQLVDVVEAFLACLHLVDVLEEERDLATERLHETRSAWAKALGAPEPTLAGVRMGVRLLALEQLGFDATALGFPT